MARFLSDEWFEEINQRAMPVPDDLDVVIEQHVAGGPEGDVAYQVRVGGGRVTIGPLDAVHGDADVVLLLDYATAAALGTGRLTAHDAFLAGRIRLRGGVSQLERAAAGLAAIGPAMAELAKSTSY